MSESIFVWEEESWDFTNSDHSKKNSDHEINFQDLIGEDAAFTCPTPRFPTAVALSAFASASAAAATITGKKRGQKSQGVDDDDDEEPNADAAAVGKKVVNESEHEIHIWTERERRKRMRGMFVNLHAMLPQLPPKADKSSIVDEAISFIKTCEETLHKLQKQKQEENQKVNNSSREAFIADYNHQGSSSNIINPSLNNNSNLPSSPSIPSGYPIFPATFKTWVSPNVVLSITGDNAHINVCCLKKLGFFTAITYFMEKHNLEVVSVQTSSPDDYRTICMIHARASGTFQEMCSFEGKIQQAAVEIMNFINSVQ